MSRTSDYLDRIEELEIDIMDAENKGEYDKVKMLEKELSRLEEKLCH